jgi:tetratricopeptide (TPR) repeat protein
MRTVSFVSLLVGAFAAASVVSAQDAETKWTGRTVVTVRDEYLEVTVTRVREVQRTTGDGKTVKEQVPYTETFKTAGMHELVVRDDDGNRVKVRSRDGQETWIAKDKVVPIEDADGPLGDAIRKHPDSIPLRRTRARVRQLRGDLDGALGDLTAAVALDPASAAILHQRALVHADRKDFEKALGNLDEAVAIATEDPTMRCALAEMRSRSGRFAEAVADYEEVLREIDDHEPALNGLAWMLATCPTAENRDGRRAVKLAESAVESSKRKNASYLDTLAAAYAEAGRFDDAVRVQQEALADREFRRRSGNAASERLEGYKQRKAYREMR